MPYVPHTPEDERAMLDVIGLERREDLFRSIPEELRLQRPLRVPERRSENEILREFDALAASNTRLDDRPSFLGAGTYNRFIPAAVDYLSSRGEFSTAYTPYQPEVSQGTLQAIFEYQTMICRLTGMEIANASMYEGATALTEAVLMAHAVRQRGTRVLISPAVHPEYRATLDTYLVHHEVQLVDLPLVDGVLSPGDVGAAIDDDTIAVVLQSPNFYGLIEDGEAISRAIGEAAARAAEGFERPLLIAAVDPISLALLRPPGDYGADIAVGDGQQLGNAPFYGGPSFGFFATREEHVRKIPGRIVGETTDRDGRRGYVLTFQTREQHIRRAKATSNICTNQGLCSLRAAIYLTLLGEAGLREVAEGSTRRAHDLCARLLALPGVARTSGAPFFNEFAVRLPLDASEVRRRLAGEGIVGGLPLGRYEESRREEMLFACTELTTSDDVDRLVAALDRILALPPRRGAPTSGAGAGSARGSASPAAGSKSSPRGDARATAFLPPGATLEKS